MKVMVCPWSTVNEGPVESNVWWPAVLVSCTVVVQDPTGVSDGTGQVTADVPAPTQPEMSTGAVDAHEGIEAPPGPLNCRLDVKPRMSPTNCHSSSIGLPVVTVDGTASVGPIWGGVAADAGGESETTAESGATVVRSSASPTRTGLMEIAPSAVHRSCCVTNRNLPGPMSADRAPMAVRRGG